MEVFPQLDTLELLGRLMLSCLLGASVGLEREMRERTAGFRTHILVCTGSTVFTLISAYGFADWFTDSRTSTVMDPSRVAAQIVSGIGFLGAGAILRSGVNVRGLTTAASLWMMAAIGMAVGAGAYEIAIAATVVIIFVLVVLRRLSVMFAPRKHAEEVLVLEMQVSEAAAYDTVFSMLDRLDIAIHDLSTATDEDDEGETIMRTLSMRIGLPQRELEVKLLRALAPIQGISGLQLKR